MTLSQARALVPAGACCLVQDEPRCKRALRRLAQESQRFTPLVMADDDGLWMDCTGCAHLYGGVEAMARRIGSMFSRLGYVWRIGIAPTMRAAWALARYGSSQIVIAAREQLASAVSRLPIESLRLTPEQAQSLHAVGVQRVEELMNMPRGALAERYGATVLRWLDQATGRDLEGDASTRVEPVRAKRVLHVGRAFAGPTDRPEVIDLCVGQLLGAMAKRLEKREAGCREVVVVLRRSDLEAAEIVASASRATRDAGHWRTLLRPGLERAHLGFGVEGVEIMARGVVVLGQRQASRWLEERHTSEVESQSEARLIDTLKSRLGRDRVMRMRTYPSHMPERAWRSEEASVDVPENKPAEQQCVLERPTLLRARPEAASVMCLVPDGPLGAVTLNGWTRRVVNCSGPERICGEWWRGESFSRDYYRVHLEDGAWVWVFRVVESGAWFVHGEWA